MSRAKEGTMPAKPESGGPWRVWVDTQNRVISFHEAEGCELLEFHSRELFLNCVDQYTKQQYRYM